MTTKYMIVHCKHEGCFENCIKIDQEHCAQITQVTINIPKVFIFSDREEANLFFNEYINDVDVIDPRCKKGNDVDHCQVCTCGIVDFDEEGNTVLFYNKLNQIFLLENTAQTFTSSASVNHDVHNMNLTNKFIASKCRKLSREQKERYVELGKLCEENMDN